MKRRQNKRHDLSRLIGLAGRLFIPLILVFLSIGSVGPGMLDAEGATADAIGELDGQFVDTTYGFTVHYPGEWEVQIPLENKGRGAGVIERRILFMGPAGGVNIDIFPNPDGFGIEDWFQAHQAHLLPPDMALQKGLRVAGETALYVLDPGDVHFPPRHTTILRHSRYIYRIEYQAIDGGNYLDTYRAILKSLALADGTEHPDRLFDIVEVNPVAIQDQDCCGYHDPHYNPYPCYQGNCTWWARYNRPDTGGQQYPYWGNAGYWTSRAAEEGFTVNRTPATDALAGEPRAEPKNPYWINHVAYVESFNGSTASFSDMDYGPFDCQVDRWSQSSWWGIEFIHPGDSTPPSSGHDFSGTTGQNGWYLSEVQVTITASDNSGGSGVDWIRYKVDDGDWNTHNGASVSFAISDDGSHTLTYYAQDNASNREKENSASIRIDTTAPSGSFTINSGAGTTYATLVRVDSLATDATSGVWQIRLHDADHPWEEGWLNFHDRLYHLLPAENRRTHTVEVQFRDRAGNESSPYAQSIYLNLHPARPASRNHTVTKSTLGVSGASHRCTANYCLGQTGGQPSGVSKMSSTDYHLALGYWRLESTGRQSWTTSIYLPLILK